MDSVGETPLIPSELMRYSIAQSSLVNVDISLQVFGSPNREFSEIQNAEGKTDDIIRLVAAVFRLSYVLEKYIESKMSKSQKSEFLVLHINCGWWAVFF